MFNKVLCLSFVAATLLLTPSLVRGQNTAIIQDGSTSASATGTNNLAVSGVSQYAEQNRLGNPVNSNQLAIQKGISNAEATGYNNISTGHVEQNISQYQLNPYGNPNVFNQQTAIQQGFSDQRAIGENNTSSGYLGQFSTQDQWGQ